jgi:hypothetical protein
MRSGHAFLRILCGLALSQIACSDSGAPVKPLTNGVPDKVSFAQEVQPIFNLRCTGCHGAGGNGGLDLRAPQSHDNLVGVVSPNYQAVRVVAGDASASVLFDKVTGGGLYGERMPRGEAPLTAAQIETIRMWIMEGALRN